MNAGFCCSTFTRERIGFRSRLVTFVWYPGRGSLEVWLLRRLGAMRYQNRWYFTHDGYLVIG